LTDDLRFGKSAISYQLSAISYQLSAISYQLSAISYQLSAISYQLSEISFLRSAKKLELPPAFNQLINMSSKLIEYLINT
jgi:hypothetical protein